MVSRYDFSRTFEIKGRDFNKAGSISINIKEILKELGIDQGIVRRAAIASYEAEMNIVMYANKGEMTLRLNPEVIRAQVLRTSK